MRSKILTDKQLVELLRDACEKAGGAKPWGESSKPKVSFSYTTAVLRGDAKAGAKIGKALGYKKIRFWVEKDSIKEVVMKFEDINNPKD